jgi:hypothetical protein
MKIINTADALVSLSTSGTPFVCDQGVLIKWDTAEEKTGEARPTDVAIAAEVVRLQTIANWQYPRQTSYPSIGDQLDMIFHAGLGGDEFQAAIQAVKDDNPKP